VEWNAETIPRFTAQGFQMGDDFQRRARTFFTYGGSLRLTPVLDFANRDDTKGREVEGGTMGSFRNVLRGAVLVSGAMYKAGEEVFLLLRMVQKSAADYLLEHGFCPPKVWKTAVSELTFELDPDHRFYDDKMDILEFETYDQAPMDPVQSFDVVSDIGRDGEPDQAMVQFVRLCKLGGTDAFLLESIFRKEVWGFMALPVSEQNELQVVTAIVDACQKALDDLATCPTGGPEICMQLRGAETKALTKTMDFLREREALDLKDIPRTPSKGSWSRF
jgi:[ribulose-bisphosphate carboxylase]-lysine N-methyltransferase